MNYLRINNSFGTASKRGSWYEKRRELLKLLPQESDRIAIEFGSTNKRFYPDNNLHLTGQKIAYFLDDPDMLPKEVIEFLNRNDSILYYGGAGDLPAFKQLKCKIRRVCFASILPQSPLTEDVKRAYYYGGQTPDAMKKFIDIKTGFELWGGTVEVVDQELPTQEHRREFCRAYGYVVGASARRHDVGKFYTGRTFNAIRYGVRPLVSRLSWYYPLLATATHEELVAWLDRQLEKLKGYIAEDF